MLSPGVSVGRSSIRPITVTTVNTIDMMSGYFDNFVSGGVEEIPTDLLEELRIGTAFAASYFFELATDSIVAWNFFLPHRSFRLFVSMDKASCQFVARGKRYEPQRGEHSRIVRELWLPNSDEVKQESIVGTGSERTVFELCQSWIAMKEERQRVRFFSLSDGNEFIRLKSDIGTAVDATDSPELLLQSATDLHVENITFYCGCSSNRMRDMIATIGKESVKELFAEGDTITAECPRCGKKYRFVFDEFKELFGE